ncbi:hypothetical protein ASZ78_004434 [Callipepla squamata]|uniref:Uncharacterized protein n=1 Tax=Callipepla squamata TaxID=9009 RepID=A0A226NE03_CALSU|nr:hypothetical protein ASZ78_004434 [Callipepla squamata]
MSASPKEYTAVSSPYTSDESNEHVPQGGLKRPRFQSARWKRPPGSKGNVGSELHNSDAESLELERHSQSQLQQQIHANEELVGLKAEEVENDSLEEEDSLEKLSSEVQEEAKHGTVQNIVQKEESNSREQQPVDKYFSLKYNANWKNTKEAFQFSEVGETYHAAEEGSMDFSLDSFYPHSNGFLEEKDQQEIPEDQRQRGKKNFVEKNKRTLGLRTDVNSSYLQLHGKKQEVCQEQVTYIDIVEGEPVQSDLLYPNMKMDPEDKWCLNSQRLKNQQSKLSQRKTVKFDQNPKERAFPRIDNHQPAGRPAKPKSCHYKHRQMSEFQPAPMHAEEQDSSSALQNLLSPPDPDSDTAANSDTCLNNFPNSKRRASQKRAVSAYPFRSTQHKLNLEEVGSPARTGKKNKNSQRDCPRVLLHGQQHSGNHATVPLFTRNDSTSGQAQPNQNNISSTFNANYGETVKDQVSLQACKGHICARNTLRSPAACCTTSQLTLSMERQRQEMSCLREADDNQQLFSPFPPLTPLVESDSEVKPEKGERRQVKINQSNSEGYVMQMEKQKQHKVCKKGRQTKLE